MSSISQKLEISKKWSFTYKITSGHWCVYLTKLKTVLLLPRKIDGNTWQQGIKLGITHTPYIRRYLHNWQPTTNNCADTLYSELIVKTQNEWMGKHSVSTNRYLVLYNIVPTFISALSLKQGFFILLRRLSNASLKSTKEMFFEDY